MVHRVWHRGNAHTSPRLQAKKWATLSKKKWAAKKKHGYSEVQKEVLDPAMLRKIVKDHGDMTSRKCVVIKEPSRRPGILVLVHMH